MDFNDTRSSLWITVFIRLLFVTISVMLLSACASTIMEGYMNKPLSEVVLKYGPPSNAFDMGDGRRAFTWLKTRTLVTPGTATTYGNGTATAYGVGNNVNVYGSYYGTTVYSPPVASDLTCAYTVFAERSRTDIEGPAAWMIVSYQKPDLICE